MKEYSCTAERMAPVMNLLGKKPNCWSVMVTNSHSFSNIYLSCASLMIGKRTIVPWIGWITLFVIRDVFQFQGTMPLEIDRLQKSVTYQCCNCHGCAFEHYKAEMLSGLVALVVAKLESSLMMTSSVPCLSLCKGVSSLLGMQTSESCILLPSHISTKQTIGRCVAFNSCNLYVSGAFVQGDSYYITNS